METKTLEERIAAIKRWSEEVYHGHEGGSYFGGRTNTAKLVFEIITELQEQIKTCQEMVETTCQTNQTLVTRLCELGEEKDVLQKKLDEALAKVEIAREALNSITNREEWGSVRDIRSTIMTIDKLNKQGEKHGE